MFFELAKHNDIVKELGESLVKECQEAGLHEILETYDDLVYTFYENRCAKKLMSFFVVFSRLDKQLAALDRLVGDPNKVRALLEFENHFLRKNN